MKKITTILAAVILTASVYAQVPQMMTYQSVVRNGSGALVTNSPVGIRATILQDSTNGAIVYQEVYSPKPQTNANGLVTLQIGNGVVLSGTFASIAWGAGTYFIKTDVDPTGGTNYTISGTSQLLSVPYALYAQTASYAASTSTKIIAGATSGGFAPTITAGGGFTVSHSSTGTYQITFNVPFNSTPAITATPYESLNGEVEGVTVYNVTTSGCEIFTITDDNGTEARVDFFGFSIMAVGN